MRKKLLAIILTITMLLGAAFILPACNLPSFERFTLTVDGGGVFNNQSHFENWWNNPRNDAPNTRNLREGGQVYIADVYLRGGIVVFDGWFDGDELLSRDSGFTFTMPARNVVVTAKWTNLNDYPIPPNETIPFSQRISSNNNCVWTGDYGWDEFTHPPYACSYNRYLARSGVFDLPIGNSFDFSPLHIYAMVFDYDYLYVRIGLTHTHTGIQAWMSSVQIAHGNLLVFYVNRLEHEFGGDAMTEVYISVRVDKTLVQNITNYKIVIMDVEYAPQIKFSSQYHRGWAGGIGWTGWGGTKNIEFGFIHINSFIELKNYLDSHLLDTCTSITDPFNEYAAFLRDNFDEEFFKTKQLVVVGLIENSGGNRNSVVSVNNGTINIERYILGDTTDIGIWSIAIGICNTHNPRGGFNVVRTGLGFEFCCVYGTCDDCADSKCHIYPPYNFQISSDVFLDWDIRWGAGSRNCRGINNQRIYIKRSGSSEFVLLPIMTTNNRLIIHELDLSIGANIVRIVSIGNCQCTNSKSAIPIESKPAYHIIAVNRINTNHLLAPRDFRISEVNNDILLWTMCLNNMLRVVCVYREGQGFVQVPNAFGWGAATGIEQLGLIQGLNRIRISTGSAALSSNGVLTRFIAPNGYLSLYRDLHGVVTIVNSISFEIEQFQFQN